MNMKIVFKGKSVLVYGTPLEPLIQFQPFYFSFPTWEWLHNFYIDWNIFCECFGTIAGISNDFCLVSCTRCQWKSAPIFKTSRARWQISRNIWIVLPIENRTSDRNWVTSHKGSISDFQLVTLNIDHSRIFGQYLQKQDIQEHHRNWTVWTHVKTKLKIWAMKWTVTVIWMSVVMI